jgi:hypothetical protein
VETFHQNTNDCPGAALVIVFTMATDARFFDTFRFFATRLPTPPIPATTCSLSCALTIF